MRISDWSSDVCSSDLPHRQRHQSSLWLHNPQLLPEQGKWRPQPGARALQRQPRAESLSGQGDRLLAGFLVRQTLSYQAGHSALLALDRKRVVEGKSVSVLFYLCCCRFIEKQLKRQIRIMI